MKLKEKTYSYLIIISVFFFVGCSVFNQNDFIKDQNIKVDFSNNITIAYKLYQTGIDNYRYEFYIVQEIDTFKLFDAFLNDATYKNVKFEIVEKKDTIFIYSNYNLGEIEKQIEELNFKLIKLKL